MYAYFRTRLLGSLIPSRSDRWRFPCTDERRARIRCRMHKECQVVYE